MPVFFQLKNNRQILNILLILIFSTFCIAANFVEIAAQEFIFGDANDDGTVDVGDAVYMIHCIFRVDISGCDIEDSWDVNCDGNFDVADVVYMINYIFRGGSEPCLLCPPIEQKILFEMCYTNYAWGATMMGFYIDNEGNVYSYEYDQVLVPYPPPEWYQTFPEMMLMVRYSHNPELIATVEPSTLYEKYQMIEAAAEGELSTVVLVCLDFGIAYFVAYQYEADQESYLPVLLHQVGDYAQRNFSPEAEHLFQWLESFGFSSPCRFPE